MGTEVKELIATEVATRPPLGTDEASGEMDFNLMLDLSTLQNPPQSRRFVTVTVVAPGSWLPPAQGKIFDDPIPHRPTRFHINPKDRKRDRSCCEHPPRSSPPEPEGDPEASEPTHPERHQPMPGYEKKPANEVDESRGHIDEESHVRPHPLRGLSLPSLTEVSLHEDPFHQSVRFDDRIP